MGLFDSIVNLLGLGYQVSKDQHLTGAQREANAFTAEQAEKANEFTHSENQAAMQFSAEQAQQQMDFQERMANTQWQRGVADMMAAGLNPALAYSQGGAVAPSGAAGQGSSGQGAAGSSVNPGRGLSMSDLLAVQSFRKEMQLKDAQMEELRAAADERRANADVARVNKEWIPKEAASRIGLNEQAAAHYIADIEKLNAETRGIDLENEWNPKLWQNELDNGTVNRLHTYAAIKEINAQIDHLSHLDKNVDEDTRLKILQQGLVAAQAALTRTQDRDMSASAWHKEFENAFIEMYGHKPDEPLWNAVTSTLAQTGKKIRESVSSFGDWLKGLGANFKNNWDNLTSGLNLHPSLD